MNHRYHPSRFGRVSIADIRSLICLCGLLAAGFLHAENKSIELKYLGTAGWEIKEGGITVLVDPYLSRLRMAASNEEAGKGETDDQRKLYTRSDVYESDKATIDRIITKADFIVVTHGHSDHLGDVPYIAMKTGAKVIASDTSINILRAFGVPNEQLYTVKGGEDYQFDGISIKVLPSLHSPLGKKHYFNSTVHTKPLTPPVKLSDFTEGGTLMYYIRYPSHTLLVGGSMNFIEREVQGLTPDILIAGANGSRLESYRYAERLLKATGFPKFVLPTHWDNFRIPYGSSQEPAIQRNLKPFTEEVRAASPNSKVLIPSELKTITIE